MLNADSELKQIPMAKSLQGLELTIEELGKVIDTLAGRLENFCLPPEPMGKADLPKSPSENKSMARTNIDDIAERIGMCNRRLANIINRLEI